MKVLVCWHGAVEPAYRRLFDEIASLGVQVLLVAPVRWKEAGRVQALSSSDKGPYRTVALRTVFTNRTRAFLYPDIFGLFGTMRRFKPDVVHIMEEPFSLAASEMILLSRMAAPSAKKVLFSFENIDVPQRFPFGKAQKYNLKNSDAIIIVPGESKDIWIKRGFLGRIVKIPLGIDTGLYRRTEDKFFNAERGIFRLGYSGRVVEEKGLQTVIEAIAALSKKGLRCRLHVAGDGEYRQALVELAKRLGVEDAVEFHGPMSQEKLPAFYSSIDAFVLPSLTTHAWKEQFGRVLAEAMACGSPVIGSDSGEIPNVIGDTGLVFREGDPEDLAVKIESLISDEGWRKRLSEDGVKKARSEYSWAAVAERYFELYKEITWKR